MSKVTFTVYKCGLTLEAELSKLTRKIQKQDKLGYKIAFARAEKEINPVQYVQVISTDSEELDHKSLQLLGHHVSQGAPFDVKIQH